MKLKIEIEQIENNKYQVRITERIAEQSVGTCQIDRIITSPARPTESDAIRWLVKNLETVMYH